MHREGLKRIRLVIVLILLVLFILRVFAQPDYVLPILMYHSISEPEGCKSSLCVSPGNFAQQMQYLKRFNYKVLSLDEFIELKKKKGRLKRAVVITFDDGFEDNYLVAYPVLKRYGFPAAIFVVADWIGNRPGYLNWDELRQMQKSGLITIGSHTMNHQYVPSLKDEADYKRELFASKRLIERYIGGEVKFFSYPLGGFTEEAQLKLQEYGYKAAVTTNRGWTKANDDLYALKRIKMTNNAANPLVFLVETSGYYTIFKHRRSPY